MGYAKKDQQLLHADIRKLTVSTYKQKLATSSQDKNWRSKPLQRLKTTTKPQMRFREVLVNAITAEYHPKDEPQKQNLDQS